MSKRLLTAFGAVLVASTCAIGQSPAEPLPPPTRSAAPIANGTSRGFDVERSEPALDWQNHGHDVAGLFTVGAEYLLWIFPKRHDTALIATDGSVNGVAGNSLARAGDGRLDRRVWSGGQVTFGYWIAEPNHYAPLMDIKTFGVESRFFVIGERSVTARNDSSPVIVRPFFDLNRRIDNAVVVAAPGLATGSIAATAKLNMWGSEANVWKSINTSGPYPTCGLGVMAGFRYLELNPEIEINRVSVFGSNLAQFPAFLTLAGSRIQETERFSIRNQFYGGQFGATSRLFLDGFFVDTTLKLALGSNNQQLTIEGNQIRTLPNGSTVVSRGALLALPSNSGSFSKVKFSQVPELDTSINWPVLSSLTFRFDFTAMYWSKVLRAREQIDTNIDVTQIPNFPGAAGVPSSGLQQPGVTFTQSDLWVLGVGVGVELTW